MTEFRRYFKEVRFRQLRSMVELKRLGSFSAVAESVGISVPSVWQQIRALEAEFDVSLAVSSGRGASLTDEGNLLADMASGLVQDFDRLLDQFRNRVRQLPRRLTIATTSSLLFAELKKPLCQFREQWADVELSFFDRPSSSARTLLLEDKVALAVIGRLGDDEDDYESAGYQVTHLTRYPFVLMAPEGHPLLTRKRVSVKDVVKEPLVVTARGANSRRGVEAVFGRYGLLDRMRITLDASHFDVLTEYVKLGFGIAVISVSPMVLHEAQGAGSRLQGLGFRDMTRLFGQEEVILLRRTKRFEPDFERAFCEVLTSSIGTKGART